MLKCDFKHIKLLSIDGNTRIDLKGIYDADALSDRLIEEWIPYFECHKCGKGDYCKYTQPAPGNPKHKLDIKCGVAKDALSNFIHLTFHFLDNANEKQKQDYLDGAYHFYDFVIKAEQHIGFYISKEKIEWRGNKNSIMTLADIITLRDILNRLGDSMKSFPDFDSGSSLLLVEGETEKVFLEKLKESGSTWFVWLIIESYGGKPNKLPKRIQMLINDYKRKGYKVYFQGDADGKEGNMFKEFIDKKTIPAENAFQFKFDFETAIPSGLLWDTLNELNLINNATLDSFRDKMSIRNEPISKILLREYSLDIETHKMNIAKKAGEILNKTSWWTKDDFMETELGLFLDFIRKIN